MIPPGQSLCTEITTNECSFIVVIIVDTGQKEATVFMTDCEECFTGNINTDQINELLKNMGIPDQNVIYNLLKCAVQQKKLLYNNKTSQLVFSLSYCNATGSLPVNLKQIDKGQRQSFIKNLFFHTVREIVKDQDALVSSAPISKSVKLQTRKISSYHHEIPTKQRFIGRSVLNPGLKRVHMGSGIQFADDKK